MIVYDDTPCRSPAGPADVVQWLDVWRRCCPFYKFQIDCHAHGNVWLSLASFCYAGTNLGGIFMSRTAVALFTVALFFHSTAFTENTPNFSGTWKSDIARSDSAHQGTPIGPITLIISQTATEITIETNTRAKDRPLIANEKLIYRLDGSETRMAGNSATPVVCKAHWDGADLVTETARNLNGSTVTTSWRLTMDPHGKELTIKKTLTVQHGYQSLDARNVGTGTDIFVKMAAGTKK